jgi:hypothetical protein
VTESSKAIKHEGTIEFKVRTSSCVQGAVIRGDAGIDVGSVFVEAWP